LAIRAYSNKLPATFFIVTLLQPFLGPTPADLVLLLGVSVTTVVVFLGVLFSEGTTFPLLLLNLLAHYFNTPFFPTYK